MTLGVQLALAFASALVATLLLGKPAIAQLARASLRQHAYEDAPRSHASKTGTPTMGGLLFACGLLAALAWRRDAQTALVAFAGGACGLVGSIDDLRSILRGRNRGLRARTKFVLTGLCGIGSAALAATSAMPERGALLSFGAWTLHGPLWLWYALAVAAVVATTHAVNLTDGLDGLAGGTILPPLAVFAWLGWRSGNLGVTFADVAVAGSVLGFLAYNRHPARVFMGDTGALALGGVLAASAVLTGNVLLLPLVGGVFAAETLSVILQVASYKTTRRRIFRMSPLHHHFELGGWPETRVTRSFWTASALLSLAGAALAR